MPHELASLDEVDDKLLERTFVIYRKGLGDTIKYKLRTKSTLFTLKVEQGEASSVEARINESTHPIEIIDV